MFIQTCLTFCFLWNIKGFFFLFKKCVHTNNINGSNSILDTTDPHFHGEKQFLKILLLSTKKKKVIKVKKHMRVNNDDRIFFFGLITKKHFQFKHCSIAFCMKKLHQKSHFNAQDSIFHTAFSDMSPESCIILSSL